MMRKFFLFSFTLIFLNLTAQIQSKKNFTDGLKYGVKFGLSASHLTSNNNTINVRASFLTGLTAEYPIYKKLNVKLDLLYLRQGESDRSNSIENGRVENNLKLDYFSIPVLLSYPVLEKLRIESGLGMSFLVRARQDFFTNSTQITSIDTDDYSDFDLNLNIGLYYPTTWDFVVGIRYSRGLIAINENDDRFIDSAFNSILQLSLEYRF